ncbi:MarR family winged helix-turn-helix transcriptional regulator [Megalodesulfovibrio paquesii]
MRRLGIKRGWIALLLEVLAKPGQPQDALCRAIKVDRAVTARTLFELEQHGYVERREDASDRRLKRVFPTSKATSLSDRLYAVLGEHNHALFKGFDAAQQAETLTLLAAMAANLEAALEQEASHHA